jgi:endonuclease/exonuclease/phosphatase family metal-dependent hydrolase
MVTINVATLNISGLVSRTKLAMLGEFLRCQEIDILLLQEVTHPTFDTPRGYKSYFNVGTAGRGTALITSDEFTITNVKQLPSDRGKTAEYKGIRMINIYAPSGTVKRQEREHFYTSDLTYLLEGSPSSMIMGGDFNCILNKSDTTGYFNYSKALDGLVRELGLQDMWQADPSSKIFTHSPTDASRIDLIYTTKELSANKIGVETVAAVFTDHLAVILRLSVNVPMVRRGRGLWKLNATLLEEEAFREKIHQQWVTWTQQRRNYSDWTTWWGRYTKKKIRLLCIQEGVERRRDFMQMENIYYDCICDVLRNNHPHDLKMAVLNRLKAKITTLHRTRLHRVMFDNVDPNRLEGEKRALFHFLQTRKRQEVRMIQSVQDEHGNTQTTTNGIMQAFTIFLGRKYEPLAVKDGCIECMAEIGRRNLPTAWREQLEQPISP